MAEEPLASEGNFLHLDDCRVTPEGGKFVPRHDKIVSAAPAEYLDGGR